MLNIDAVGNAIFYLRKRAGYTQKELADRIGVSDKAVSKWERGLGLPDISLIGKLAILLDTDTDSLLAGDVIHHDKEWSGILLLEDNLQGIGARTIIYDKPLVYFLLGYFMLLGIRKIDVVCTDKDRLFLQSEFGDGSSLGICLACWPQIPIEQYSGDSGNVMVVFGKSLIYGVDQTRFFQKAMVHKNRITVLSLPKKKSGAPSRIYFDSDRKVVSSEEDDCLKTQYDYYQIPILFCPQKVIRKIDSHFVCASEAVSAAISSQKIYTVVLDRGFVELPIETWNDVSDASMFVKMVQKACGMQIYCIEEIAWRRGMISDEVFQAIGREKSDTEYGKYIKNLYENE